MCGIVGILNFKAKPAAERLEKMMNVITHRGPDSSGVYLEDCVALGHRRLAIQDLSYAGHQPMVSVDGRFVISFNGEIYNHLEIREDIGQSYWRGHSDTETILAGIEKWGLENLVSRCVGMFAFAVWDIKLQVLHLVRDRVGEKPLYYGFVDNDFIFCSELKSIKSSYDAKLSICHSAVSLYMSYGYIPAPYSIYSGIYKLLPGSILTINKGNIKGEYKPSSYWLLSQTKNNAKMNSFKGSYFDAKTILKRKIEEAVSLQTISDVGVGALLSGGIDSSLVVSALQTRSSKLINTYTVGFDVSSYDESKYAKHIADYLGTNHTTLTFTLSELKEFIPTLSTIFDEPFGDSSQLPMLAISKLISKHHKVVLSGDGADEFFGGYSRYLKSNRLRNLSKLIPISFLDIRNDNLTKHSLRIIENMLGYLGIRSNRPISTRFDLVLDSVKDNSGYDYYKSYLKQIPSSILLNKEVLPLATYFQTQNFSEKYDYIDKMMLFDASQYLPDDILVKTDRSSMAHGLEMRVPFLDHRIIEFSLGLPLSWKVSNNSGKLILKDILKDYLPESLFNRPKQGFGVPVDRWLRNELKDWAEDLLSENRIKEYGIFDFKMVNQIWLEHLSGKYNWRDALWAILNMQSWLSNVD